MDENTSRSPDIQAAGEPEKKDKMTTRILTDLKRARSVKRDWAKEAEEDFEFAVGKQWKDEDKAILEGNGVPALTINKIQPNIFLISGHQRQNRTDFVAYPEGDEDNVMADIVTRLLKNALKDCEGDHKSSEQFEDGVICGEAWLEPFIDYTHDVVNGDLNLKKINPFTLFVDPDSVEYDLSDAEYVIKVSPRLTKNQVLRLFPDKEAIINGIQDGSLKVALADGDNNTAQTLDYPMVGAETKNEGHGESQDTVDNKPYDLIEYHYKEYIKKYFIADKSLGKVQEAKDKQAAEKYVETMNTASGTVVAKIIERLVPEIWICAMIGNVEIDKYICPFYPKWKTYAFIPFWAHKITTPLRNARELMVQGIVRSLKDPQRELNKRRSQELRILNSTANSGWLCEENTWKNKNDVEKYGSTPGVTLEYKTGKAKPERITPAPLSQGHAQLAAENTQDIKEISGINADLLAMQDKDMSGRAIHLRQQQGIVMLQRVLDNFYRTNKILGRFILSQLADLYTVETAMRVCGSAFIKENFSMPVMQPDATGQGQVPKMGPDNQMVMQVDQQGVMAVFNQVLNDIELGKYDVTIDTDANTPTTKYANFMALTDMASKGIPIPPSILIDESMIGEASKQKIKKAFAAAPSPQTAMPAAKTGK